MLPASAPHDADTELPADRHVHQGGPAEMVLLSYTENVALDAVTVAPTRAHPEAAQHAV